MIQSIGKSRYARSGITEHEVFDTNVWIDALAGKLAASVFLEFVSQPNWIGCSAITRLELFGYPGLGDEEEQKITELLKQFSEISVIHALLIKRL